MGSINSKIFHSDNCNKCGVSYNYYSSKEHQSRMSCKTKKCEFEYHCFACIQYIPWWT